MAYKWPRDGGDGDEGEGVGEVAVDIESYQDWTESKWNGRGIDCVAYSKVVAEQLCNALIGDYGEGGELADLLKKLLFHRMELTEEVRAQLRKELGDKVYYWARLAALLGFDATEVLEANMAKLNARYPEGFDPERSASRDESREG